MSKKLGWLLLFVSVLLGVVLFSISSHGQALSASRINLNNSCPVGNPPAGTSWACIDGTGNLACTKSDGTTCLPTSGASGVVFAPTVSQTVVQPSTGGTSAGTSMNSNVFQQVRYADGFAWSQSPTGTISVGANTITINGVRGINQASFSPGINNSGSFALIVHKIRIAGTGTPEVVTITGSTCTGSSSGTCTITFTAANSHSAGYTVGTATAGFQEAIVDTFTPSVVNPVTGWTVKGSPYSRNHNITFYGSLNIDEIPGSVGGLHLDCDGATLEDAAQGAAMIVVGGNHAASNTIPTKTLIDNCHFAVTTGLGRKADGTQVYILDQSQSLTLAHNDFDGALQSPCTDCVDNLVTISGDQHFTFEKNVWNNPPVKCDLTWCRASIYGDHTNNAAIGAFYDNYMSGGDAIEWVSGNGITLHGNVFQNWVRYPWRYGGGLAGINDLGGNYYEGSCAIVNPDFGVAGYSCNTGRQVATTGTISQYSPGQDEAIGVIPHSFSNTGANIYNYYIAGHLGTKWTRPLFIGTASTNGVTNFTVLFLSFGADSYDVLRSGPQNNDGTDAAPWGTGNWAVATGIICASSPCTYIETFAAPTSYGVHSETQSTTYVPQITYWPVPLFLQGSGTSPSLYIGPAISGFVSAGVVNAYFGYYDAIFTSDVASTGVVTGMHIVLQVPHQTGASITNEGTGATIVNPDAQVEAMFNRKGRINFTSLSSINGNATNGIIHDNLTIQTYDSEGNKTLATQGHQPLLAAADIGFGHDTDPRHQATMCGAFWCDWYVNSTMDSGTSRKMRLTTGGLDLPTGENYTINGVTQSIDAMSAPGSNTEILSNQGGTPGTVAGFTVTAGGNVNVPGTLGVTGLLTGTTANYSGNVTVGSLTTAGSAAMHIHSTFGNTQATPAAGENGMTFLTASGILQCYQNGGALGSCSFPLFNGTGTQQILQHAVQDACVLGTSCSVTLTGSSVFTSSTSYTCTAQDQTAAAATKVVQSSGSAFVITGTGTDSIRYSCIGN